ncbi:hypothetical protein J4G48_0046915 [Bradyrhizobium barranii subsp. apii]|uniref:hypothetical protein n=1 Tax=Bradyrhizobium barranii TaxID=2992140 RepID=UPI001AA12042|nr:hypothetical protein [Bradyrhizobium barranii]UPT96456.1 hypothetical protein J4G48_0046915 [Bradyrhizobium barranii subsp. apii]
MGQLTAGMDGGTAFAITVGISLVVVFFWIVLTVTALHRRELYFWGLGSTWTSIFAALLAVGIACTSSLSGLHDQQAPLYQGPLIVAGMLYASALAYAVLYNWRATRSVLLGISTSMLQQLAVLGIFLLIVRWQGNRMNRHHQPYH